MLGNYGMTSKDNLPGGSFATLKCQESKFGTVNLWSPCLAKISLSLKLKGLFTINWRAYLFLSKLHFTLQRHYPVTCNSKYNFRELQNVL